MRILLTALLGLFVSVIQVISAGQSFAACSVPRTIELDPSQVAAVNGRDKWLGLKKGEVILTFDDGPVPGSTESILDTLKENCLKATFFSVGRMARSYPKIAKRIVREGHTLAHHTHDHERLTKHSNDKVEDYVETGISLVEKAAYGSDAGEPRVPFFRYPYLARNKRTDGVLRRHGLIHFEANIDSLDWKRDTPSVIVNRVMKRLEKEGKGIILMHDIHKRTATALPDLIKRLDDEGYEVVHVVPGHAEPLMVAALDDKKILTPAGLDETLITRSIRKKAPDRKPQSKKFPENRKFKVRITPELREGFIILAGDIKAGTVKLDTSNARKDTAVTGTAVRGLAPAIKKWALREQLAGL